MEEETKKKQENVVAGVVGAFLGTLIGVACTVIVGQLGYTAAFTGLIMAVGAMKGYELLGGRLSKKGAVICCVLVVAMTWFAHRLTWAVAVSMSSHIGVFVCFRAIPGFINQGVIEARAYWADLVMLYLFTLAGAVPLIVSGLRNANLPDYPERAAASAAQEPEKPDAVFYVGDVKWMSPLRISGTLAMFVGFVPAIALLFIGAANDNALGPILAAGGCIISCFVMIFAALGCIQPCNYALLMLVRANGTLWRVSLAMLNTMDTYRFTKKIGIVRAVQWAMLNEEERERAKASTLRAIDLLSSGQVMPGSNLSLAVIPLTNLRIDKETKWAWKGVYSAGGGKEKKITIPKAYPNFVPALGVEPAEGPVPARWGLVLVSVVLAAVLGLAGGAFGAAIDGPGLHGHGSPSTRNTPPPVQTSTPAPTPAPDTYAGVTDGEARAQFHVASELGYEYTAVGYIKAPEEMFGHEAWVDVHVPYSEEPEYLDDGYGIRSAAHGMEVGVNITKTTGNAQTVVDLAYGLLGASGFDLYEEGTTETQYVEEYDIAVKRVTYYEENRTKVRVAILYADYKADGYYLSACIVYQPERMDEDYPALLAELSDAYALNLPEIPAIDQV